MSLRTKMMASIFVFLVLVFGLLTLNLWLDAAARSRVDAQRNADLIARVISDLARSWTSRYPAWTEEAWAEYPIGSPVPVAEAARVSEPIIVATREERDARYPVLAAVATCPSGAPAPTPATGSSCSSSRALST